ncbi:TPA: hypothetical protein K8M95_001452 [Clostridium perfringens]|uniref:hypothetical protein n=3 Tax=Clostridium perfringens TaxID=1502 RepID=UPI001A1E900B|nr:hypothetical protein [Clostridium perfringens]ELC8383011.1 hypothetical protein [Clostridium perfringens]MDT7912205.1 hypothetical protein [Clostridium perfringens]MDT7925264.1 hypothetical protein [Clostridium perfringens]MDT7958576.1 hypothetical protein [Clostridium perfringens]MDT7975214.1 hypothetical protein [Clostridium perfringens]
MDRLINFINSFIDYSDITQSKNKLILKFSYFNKIDEFITYENIKNLVEAYPNTIKLFLKFNSADEVDLVDCIEDEEEFNDELNSIEKEMWNFQININFIALLNSNNNLKNNNIEIYYNEKLFLEKFYIKNNDYREFEEKFFKNNKNIVLLLDSNTFFYNNNILITNIHREELINEINMFENIQINDESKSIDLRNSSCNWIGSTKKITPNSIFIDLDNNNFIVSEDIKKILLKINCNLVILFISNYSGIDENMFKSLINGSKRVEIIYDDVVYTINAYKNLNTIYNWIYKNPVLDKLNICRNVISALITAKCQGSRLKTILENSDLLVKSLKDNYEVYSSENISKYFKEKNNLKKELQNEIKSINDQLDNLIKMLITNMTSLIGISIAGVVGYIAKGEFFSVKFLSVLYLIQLDINILLNFPIIIIRFIESNKSFKLKANEYGNLYFSDETLVKYNKKKNFNSIILIIYIVVSIIIVVVIHVTLINLLINPNFANWVISIFNH